MKTLSRLQPFLGNPVFHSDRKRGCDVVGRDLSGKVKEE